MPPQRGRWERTADSVVLGVFVVICSAGSLPQQPPLSVPGHPVLQFE